MNPRVTGRQIYTRTALRLPKAAGGISYRQPVDDLNPTAGGTHYRPQYFHQRDHKPCEDSMKLIQDGIPAKIIIDNTTHAIIETRDDKRYITAEITDITTVTINSIIGNTTSPRESKAPARKAKASA